MTEFTKGELDALRAVSSLWPDAKLVILGASALQCFMSLGWRKTQDLDLSVAARVEDVSAAVAQLPGWLPDPRQEQRWITPDGVAVDLVPASHEALERGYIEWPSSTA